MKDMKELRDLLKQIKTMDLWAELGRRFNIQYGKLQVAFHRGKPSEYVDVDQRVNMSHEDND